MYPWRVLKKSILKLVLLSNSFKLKDYIAKTEPILPFLLYKLKHNRINQRWTLKLTESKCKFIIKS